MENTPGHSESYRAAFLLCIYLFWLALTAIIFFLLITGRTALLTAIARYSAKGFHQSMQTQLFDKIYVIVAAVVALVAIIASERYLAKSNRWKILLLRFALVLGITQIVLAFFTFITQAFGGNLFSSAFLIFVLFGPFLVGCALIVLVIASRRSDGIPQR